MVEERRKERDTKSASLKATNERITYHENTKLARRPCGGLARR
jgi:hypothetical protein